MINDEVVDGYLELIRKSGVKISTTRLLKKFSSHAKQHPVDRQINMNCLATSGAVFIPIHHSSFTHWTFARLIAGQNNDSVIAEHFDSLNLAPVTMLETWIRQRFPGIPMKLSQGRCPQQKNGTDCGLFMLMGIRLMAFGAEHLSQSEADEIMPTFRSRVLAEILSGTLDPTPSDYSEFIIRQEAAEQDAEPNIPLSLYQGTGESGQPICLDTPEPSLPEINSEDVSDILPSSSDEHHTASLPSTDSSEYNGQILAAKHVSKSTKPTGIKQGEKLSNLIESFAQEQSMVNMLRSAVMASRTRSVAAGPDTLAALWNELACDENPQHTLITRHLRERFSRMLYKEVERLGGSRDRVVPRIRFQMETLLNCHGDRATWKAAQAQAAKSSIWTELIECFAPFLGPQAPVVICACPQSTTTLESMTRNERCLFIRAIQSRLRDPHDQTLVTLGAASGLYNAITTNTLPRHTIAIERTVDLTLIDFAATVNLDEAPLRLPLPILANPSSLSRSR